MDLGVDAAIESLELTDAPADVVDELKGRLTNRLDANAGYLRDSLLPDLKAGKYEADKDESQDDLDEQLDGRVGMYAAQLQPTAYEGLSATTSDQGVLMDWLLDPAAEHCDNCPAFADGGPYCDPQDNVPGAEPLPAFPGDGTDCLVYCHCTLEFEQASWNAYAEANGLSTTEE